MNPGSPFQFNSGPVLLDEAGAAMIELAISIGFLVFLFFATLEYVRAIQLKQNLTVIVREAGNTIFRECSEFDPSPADPNDGNRTPIQKCVDNASTRFKALTENVIPGGVDLIVTVYDSDEATPLVPPVRLAAYTSSGNFSWSRFYDNAALFNSNEGIGVGQTLGRMVIAEVRHDFQPLVIPNIARVVPSFYDMAIY